jgi:2,5-dihydroxypyridine 5,6-dioxygenase
MPDDATEARVKDHVKRLRATKAMRVTIAGRHRSAHFARRRGGRRQLGLHHPPRHHDPLARRAWRWPSRRRAASTARWCWPSGDVNLTFKRYIERPITLTIENDYVTAIEGAGWTRS